MLRDVDDEMRFHIEMRAAELRALGANDSQAHAEARRRFGDENEFRDYAARVGMKQARWTRVVESLDACAQDIRFAVRQFRRTPGFTAIAVLTLALGIGANAAIFSFLDQVFLRAPAGVEAPERVRRLWTQMPVGKARTPWITNTLQYHFYTAVADAVRDQAQLALFTTQTNVPLGRSDASGTANIAYATASYFPALGVHPEIGRWFTDAEADVHGAARVVVVGDALWRKRFGGDASALGQSLIVDGREFTIIGVAPPGFSGIDLQQTELWLPLGTMPTRETVRASFWDSSVIFFSVFGRMMPGADERLVEERATTAYRHAPVTDFPQSDSAQIYFRSIIDARGPGPRPREVSIGIRLAFVAVIILLITAANVVNLLLARAVARRREVAVRLALGISRSRLVRLFVIESVLLSLAAGAAGLLSAQFTGGLLRAQLLPGIQFAHGPLRGMVVAFAVALSLVTGVAAGFVTAAHGSKPDLTRSLKAGAQSGAGVLSLLPKTLVGAQAALSVMLLTGAALLVSSLLNVQRLHIGYDAPRLAFVRIVLPHGERPDSASFAARMREAGDRVLGVPGVEAIAFAREEPMSGFGRVRFYTNTDSSEAPNRPLPTASYVSSEYFRAVGLTFFNGAAFSDQAANSSAVVVNQEVARTYWPGRNPVGQCIRFQSRDNPCLIVAGVVGDAIRDQLLEDAMPQLYLPIFGSARGNRPPEVMLIRAEPARLPLVMRQASAALRDAFPRGEPVATRMSDRLAPRYRPWQLGAALFSAFGLLALLVAALGIYSNVSYSVTQRVQELGVRIALGARAGDVMRHVVGRGVRPVVGGGIVGAVLALAGARLISSLLYGIAAWNPAVMLTVLLTLLLVAIAAACVPGWRATRIDPVRAMTAD
jgi:putative ABC transport system permease protein